MSSSEPQPAAGRKMEKSPGLCVPPSPRDFRVERSHRWQLHRGNPFPYDSEPGTFLEQRCQRPGCDRWRTIRQGTRPNYSVVGYFSLPA